jgi:hypothetical protein
MKYCDESSDAVPRTLPGYFTILPGTGTRLCYSAGHKVPKKLNNNLSFFFESKVTARKCIHTDTFNAFRIVILKNSLYLLGDYLTRAI